MKIVKNTTASSIFISDVGVLIGPMTNYTIPPQDYQIWSASSDIITQIGSGSAVINDGSFDLNISDGTDLIKGLFPKYIQQNERGTILSYYSEVSSVASSTETVIGTVNVSSTGLLKEVLVAGSNIAAYRCKINGVTVGRLFTNFGAPLNAKWEFAKGIEVVNGDTVEITALHNRSSVGEFNSTIVILGE